MVLRKEKKAGKIHALQKTNTEGQKSIGKQDTQLLQRSLCFHYRAVAMLGRQEQYPPTNFPRPSSISPLVVEGPKKVGGQGSRLTLFAYQACLAH